MEKSSSIFVKMTVISIYHDEMYIKIIHLKLHDFFNLHIISLVFDIGTLYFNRTFFSYAV